MNNTTKIIFAGAFIAIGGTAIYMTMDKPRESAPTEQPEPLTRQWSNPPEMAIDSSKTYVAAITTTKGTMKVKLFADETPVAVNNFIFLAKNDFYDNTPFHRILNGFMIQSGDGQYGDGTGGPGYQFADEEVTRDYERGIVAMANAGPNTNGSQFFIMHADYPLPQQYVIFGKLIQGFEILDALAETPVGSNGGGENSRPLQEVLVTDIEIEES